MEDKRFEDVFQSTSLSRGKTSLHHLRRMAVILSIHFPLTREDFIFVHHDREEQLSIHFPLTREDQDVQGLRRNRDLSIHFPLTREDEGRNEMDRSNYLSIHFPLTREDCAVGDIFGRKRSFNPLPSHEGRLHLAEVVLAYSIFQSTSLSRGKTILSGECMCRGCFQSTSLSRGKTFCPPIPGLRDMSFNPLPSHEGRRRNWK